MYVEEESLSNKVKALIYTFAIVLFSWLFAMFVYYISLLAKSKIQQKLKNELRCMVGNKIGSLSYLIIHGVPMK